jgi:hypothetical protein
VYLCTSGCDISMGRTDRERDSSQVSATICSIRRQTGVSDTHPQQLRSVKRGQTGSAIVIRSAYVTIAQYQATEGPDTLPCLAITLTLSPLRHAERVRVVVRLAEMLSAVCPV